jgi:ketosteroid isomerase-like protein
METRGDNGGVIVAIAIFLTLLLLGGGAGVFYFINRYQTTLAMQTKRALLAEAEARMEAERARSEALTAAASTKTSNDQEPAIDQPSIRTAVESILNDQQDAWNRGDIEAFMEHYWKSDDLTFSSEGKTTKGWTATLTRYRERYPSPEKMGHLKLSELEITPLGKSAAMVLGKWNVERESEPLGGNFSLVIRKFDERWLIVHDHTSRLKE